MGYLGGRARTAALAAAAAALCAAAPASALDWGETASRAVPGGGPASCLRSGGGGGLLSLLGPLAGRTTAFDVIAPSDHRLAPAGRARFGLVDECPATAANDAGTAVVASADYVGQSETQRVRVALRDGPGQVTLTTLQGPKLGFELSPVAAVGPAGDAAVAWAIDTHYRGEDPDRAALYVARRPPGGGFGPPERIARWRVPPFFVLSGEPAIALGIDATGATTVAWARPRVPQGDSDALSTVDVATAARGRPAGSAQRLRDEVQELSQIALAVTPSGDALVAFDGDRRIRLYERRGAAFAARRAFRGPVFGLSEPALAEAPDGSAVLAWRELGDESVRAVRRRAHDAFGAPERLAPGSRGGNVDAFGGFFGGEGGFAPPDLDGGGAVRAAIAPDGRAIVTWIGQRRVGSEGGVQTAFASRARPSKPFSRRAPLGSPCRPPNGIVPTLLPSGRLAAAWIDGVSSLLAGLEIPRARGRLHLSLPGAPHAPMAAPPRVKLNVAHKVRLKLGQELRFRVHCDRACDLRGYVPTAGLPRAVGSASLAHAGTAILHVRPDVFKNVAPTGGGRIQVAVHAC